VSSHKCLACTNGRVQIESPYFNEHTCEFCGGSGWINDEYNIQYFPINQPMKGDEEGE